MKTHSRRGKVVPAGWLAAAVFLVAATGWAQAPGARSVMVDGELFLGGNFIELGISAWGDFGTMGPRPAGFFGTAAHPNIGMSVDQDGFNNGREDLNCDIFLPGSPYEAFSAGYDVGGVRQFRTNYRLGGDTEMPTVVTNTSAGDLLRATIVSTWEGILEITRVVSFRVDQKFFRVDVTLRNISDQNFDGARFLWSFDPDNTVDVGGNFDTRNIVTHTIAEDGKAVVVAQTYSDLDPIFVEFGTRAPIFLYSKNPRAVASVSPGWTQDPYDPESYDAPSAREAVRDGDYAISMCWDTGPLAAGAMRSFTTYASLDDRDFDDVLEEIDEDDALGGICDFDGDGRTDIAVYHPGAGNWYILDSSTAGTLDYRQRVENWGWWQTVPVPGDYDGDGITDLAVYHPQTGMWYIMESSNPGVVRAENWGWWQTVPVPGDYDGDGKTDLAVYHPQTGMWYIHESSNPGVARAQNWGWSAAMPVPGDYDGDGKTDLAVFHRAAGNWHILESSTAGTPAWEPRVENWGWGAVIPVPGDYDGDGKTDLAVYFPQDGMWIIHESGTPGVAREENWGWAQTTPVMGDYDRDGKADLAVYHPQTGMWYIVESGSGQIIEVWWGWREAVPVCVQNTINRWYRLTP